VTETTTVVYFAQMGDCVKIGYATDLRKRIAALCLPMSAVIATMPGGRDLESDLHARFARSRIDRSEWFTITPDLEEFIQSIGAIRDMRRAPGEPEPVLTMAEVPHRMLHGPQETAVLLKMREAEIWPLLASGKLRFIKIGGLAMILRTDIDALRSATA
jgi:hypothetical protein